MENMQILSHETANLAISSKEFTELPMLQDLVDRHLGSKVQWSYRGTIQQKPLYSSLHIYMKFYIAVKYYIYYILAIIYQFCMAIVISPLFSSLTSCDGKNNV